MKMMKARTSEYIVGFQDHIDLDFAAIWLQETYKVRIKRIHAVFHIIFLEIIENEKGNFKILMQYKSDIVNFCSFNAKAVLC